jgi:rubrerythrin
MALIDGIQKILTPFIEIPDFGSFSVIGDPGCDGLGAEIMSIFAAGLRACGDSDFTLIAGDLVPFGAGSFYQNVADFINTAAKKPVFTLCGNHDSVFYKDYFGNSDYAIADSKTLIVVLDNSKRDISDSSLELLRSALDKYRGRDVVLSMHIPPPNGIAKNAIAPDIWAKVTTLLAPLGNRLKYIICGHLHSYFEDSILGARLVVTGGCGARIEEVPGVPAPYYHRVKFFYKDGELRHEKLDIFSDALDFTEKSDEKANKMLAESFERECAAFVRYRLFAEDARIRGFEKLAKLFMAASDAEFYHAKNFYFTQVGVKEPETALRESIEAERFESEEYYKENLAYAESGRLGLVTYAFKDALEAEKVHLRLFERALDLFLKGESMPDEKYYTCTSCGNTFAGSEHPKNCPVCGAPADKISELG